MSLSTPDDAEFSLTFETTPNPRARKVLLNRPLRIGAPVAYQRATGTFESGNMISKLLETEHITDLYLRDNVLTVTQDGTGSWYLLEDIIRNIIEQEMSDHDPHYAPPETKHDTIHSRKADKDSPQIKVIREILDQTITPYIESHGGAVELIDFDTETHRLTIGYDGACGNCPSSLGMTLSAIQNMLRDQYDPQLVVTVSVSEN